MQPNHAFGVLIRAMGAWVVVQFVVSAPASITGVRSIVGIISRMAQAMLAYHLLFKADSIVAIVYPSQPLNDRSR